MLDLMSQDQLYEHLPFGDGEIVMKTFMKKSFIHDLICIYLTNQCRENINSYFIVILKLSLQKILIH